MIVNRPPAATTTATSATSENAATLTAAVIAGLGEQATDAESELRQLEQRLAAAWVNGDRAFIEGLLADTWTVTYASAVDLMRDLRGMGETNAVLERPRHFTRRTTLLRAAAIYHSMFADKSGRIPATFQVIMLTGWALHGSQPRPLKPGSAVERKSPWMSSTVASA